LKPNKICPDFLVCFLKSIKELIHKTIKKMKTTEIQIIPIKPRYGLITFASIVLENSLYLGSIGIYTRLNGAGYRITYPTKKIGNRNINIYHPINTKMSKAIEEAIISKVIEIIECNKEVIKR